MTLVEVLVAVVILSLALLTYLTVIQASDAGLSDGSEFTLASQAAGDQIALDQGLGYLGLTSGTTTTTVPGLSGGQMTVVIGPLDGNSANVGILQVDVTVTWAPRKAGRVPQTTSLKETTLVSSH
jgi:type II secretory pathway pseudopilin PulG